jgi:hypothetical protein
LWIYFKQIRVFLRFLELNQIKNLADSLGPPVSQPEWA